MEKPPFCPNESCNYHVLNCGYEAFVRYGHYTLRGEEMQRFKCKECKRVYSERIFSLQYRTKKKDPGLSARVFHAFCHGISNREIALTLNVSQHLVEGRLKKMAQWGILHHYEKLSKIPEIKEAVAYDGLENFAGSQFEPNNINQAIGRDSFFIYDFNLSPLNRKGKMSDRQKQLNSDIAKSKGKFPKNTIEMATSVILSRLVTKVPDGKLVLLSDEHYQYRRAIEKNIALKNIHHITVSSKATRNFQNILFPVNHADLLIRKRVGAFGNQTICFSKTHARMCQKFVLFLVNKNYMRKQFTKKLKTRPEAHKISPAEALKIETKTLKFHEFFSELRTPTQIKLPDEIALIFNDKVPYPRKVAA